MSELSLQEWLSAQLGVTCTPLFDTGPGLEVRTHVVGRRRLVRRHPAMEAAIISQVKRGLADPSWSGLVYIMAWGTLDDIWPLYVGLTRRSGRTHPVSANIANVERNKGKFARWGDGSAYHIGDLSQALFGFKTYKQVEAKYESWREQLFVAADPPVLRQPVSLLLIPWSDGGFGPGGEPCNVAQLEKELIALATAETDGQLLNRVDVPWWAEKGVRPPGNIFTAKKPIEIVREQRHLVQVCRSLEGEKQVALDVETELYTGRLALVQLGAQRANFIIDPSEIDEWEPLATLLGSESPQVIIHNAAFERRILKSLKVEIRNVIDTLRLSRKSRGYKVSGGHGLAAVCRRELGIELDKTCQTSDWTQWPLTRAQLEYAATDVEVLLPLADALRMGASQRALALE